MNDFGSSMMTLFVLLVHGWSIILEGFSTVSPWPSIVTTCFFFTFQFISSIVVLNLLMAYILDAFKTQQRQLSQIQYLNSLEQTNRAKDEERKAEGGNVRADHADINADIHADTNCGGGGSGRYGSMMPRSNGKNNSNNSTSDTDKNYSDMPFSYQGNSATYGSSDATHSSSYGHGHGHTYNRGGHSTRGGRGLRLDLRSHSTTHVAIHDSSQDNWVENKQNYFHNLSLKFSQHYRRNHNHP